ncbi:hypothetical protein OIU83_01440 [Flavobacterium sp. LS1R49]|uniref:Lipoprotein n=1 Tax=Flavobacterium shii TaxID=2987687 RepID=A0A9X2YTA0_9FLAO|nr:hypothetical protein [Flavobacterium shii]MCV9926299.1 hypothetical protein [Flavobacterium shii]
MKTISLWLVILPSLLISCTNEQIITTGVENISKKTALNSKSSILRDPANPANPYDAAGKAHNAILEIYETLDTSTDTTILRISQRVNEIALQNKELATLNMGNDTSLISPKEIEEILRNPMVKFDQSLSKSAMTNSAKLCLSDFIDSLLLLEKEDYELIYQTIVLFEASVINNKKFTALDKKIILSATSIARYLIQVKKKRKDPDWKTSTGNLIGGVIGAIDNSFKAVTASVIIGVSNQKNILTK